MSVVLPLSNLVPLRRTSAWGSFAVDKELPIPYGRCRVTPVPADRDGYTFLLADCIIGGCEGITRDNVAEFDYSFRHGPDVTGRVVAWLVLNRPLKPNESLAAVVWGKLHPRTGALLLNPADILWDFLSAVCGLSITEGDVSAFRAQCSGDGIDLAGVVRDGTATIRATIDAMMQSTGAVWSGAMPGIAKLYPAALGSGSPAYVFDTTNMQTPKAVCSGARLITELHVPYALDWSTGNTTRTVIVSAPQAALRYGATSGDSPANWLTNPRQALKLSTRKLTNNARPVWLTSWQAGLDCRHLLPGDEVTVSHPLLPVSGRCVLLDVEVDYFGGSVSLSTEMTSTPEPVIELTGSAAAWSPVAIDGVTIAYTNGVASFTILDDQGQPLAGATITLDGSVKRTTDKAGKVQFTVGRGQHVLLIEATGYAAFEAEVTV